MRKARIAILVLGMHRSGTSALARLLGYLGAALPRDAIEAHSDNAKGYWESAAIVKADDQLLRVARSSWFDPRPLDLSRLEPSALRSRKDRIWEAVTAAFGEAPLMAIKDPRQCRFVPTIVETLAEHGVASRAVLMLRSPQAVARSIASRDGTTMAFAQLLWLRHMIDAERATRGLARAVVSFEAMLAQWRYAAAKLLPLTGGMLPEGDTAAAIDAFLDPALRHHGEDEPSGLEEPLAGIVDAVRDGLWALTERDDAETRAVLDTAYTRLEALPWLADDIIHDELRHRRSGEGDAAPAAPEPLPAIAPPAQSMPTPTPEQAEAVAMIRDSGLFDIGWYLETYPDAASSGLDPIEHYLTVGAAKGYNPNPLFDTGFYARQMARRLAAGGARP
ncbi:sulfotransferase family protein [Rhizorhabdus dicambivorans]|uniref:Sulfotransferase family protein n=2 Tax=Rhizorhabdus dicambivorans TaxID=1850238 RepID=A0A2A4FR84_9SPHN|nr:sulfotransferase family protein [Rhizorhabdus dicambivorans]PCE40224.1 sulfotransferase family protein [Rhizorhabdus dicambivorans]